MNKTDLVTENEKERVKAVIMEMNPSAKVCALLLVTCEINEYFCSSCGFHDVIVEALG